MHPYFDGGPFERYSDEVEQRRRIHEYDELRVVVLGGDYEVDSIWSVSGF